MSVEFVNKKTLFNNEIFEKRIDHALISNFTQNAGVNYIMAKLLVIKGLDDFLKVDGFLNPSLKNQMPNPMEAFLDIKIAVERIKDAILLGQKIAIFADYDVDGACCGAILKRYFRELGIDALIYIPDRFKEGYGPNTNALLQIRNAGYDLVFTVDCGTVAFEPLQEAKNAGLDIIVVDHHLGTKTKPQSIAVVNPNRFDETSDLTYLCGAGVVFMMLVALNKILRDGGVFEKIGKKEPNLIQFSDLAALATICDVVPLVGLNRAIVSTGLKQMNKNQQTGLNIGLKTLCGISGIKGQITEQDLGFALGPRINAGGRLSNSCLGAVLLSTTNNQEAYDIALKLNKLNGERKKIEEQVRILAMQQIDTLGLHKNSIIFCGHESFHQGVIGITASRIKDIYNKPVCVMEYKDGVAKASCRSVSGIDIGSIINAANNAGLLIKGGGHAMAGGYSCEISKLQDFQNFCYNYIKINYADFEYKKIVEVDSEISLSAINNDFYENVCQLGPFGTANPSPVFYTKSLIVIDVKQMGGAHLAIIFKCKFSGKTIRSVIFGFEKYANFESFSSLKNQEIDLVYKLKQNTFYASPQIEAEIVEIVC